MQSYNIFTTLYTFLPIVFPVVCAGVGLLLLLWSLPNKPTDHTNQGIKYIGIALTALGFLAVPFACFWALLALSASS